MSSMFPWSATTLSLIVPLLSVCSSIMPPLSGVQATSYLFQQQQQQRILTDIKDTCPISLINDTTILNACELWQLDQIENYNCTKDNFLQNLIPGQYKGLTANYLSFNTIQSTSHFVERAKLFEQCTGGKIIFTEANDIAEDPIRDIGTKSNVGTELYDGYLMIYSFTSEASSLGLLETLNDRIRTNNQLLQYQDIFPKVQSMGEYRKDGKTNIDLLMADGDFFVPVVRLDLLERDNKPLPHTWDDLIELVQHYNGTDLNDDGIEDDYGLCIFPRTGSGFTDSWIPELMYSTWATSDQTNGIQEGFLFTTDTFVPRIYSEGFVKAMNIWKDLWNYSSDGCISNNFITGRCAIGLAPPGCWKGIFVNGYSDQGGVARRDENGKIIWRPTMNDGTYAEPYRLKPFGSLKVVDRITNEFVQCEPDTCPKGERIRPNTELTVDDRAKILVESPHVGKVLNRVPFYWSGGFGTGIRKSAEPKVKDLLWDFFTYVNSPITSVDDVVPPSWLDAWRHSQLNDCNELLKQPKGIWEQEQATTVDDEATRSSSTTCNFQRGGWSRNSFLEHKTTMDWALGTDVNSALTLRLPGILHYTRDVMLPKFQQYVTIYDTSITELQNQVTKGWNDITTSRGKLDQLQIYRASLGLDPLGEYDLCQLHRTDMDAKDPSVCIKYDPTSSEGNYTATVVIAVLIPVLVVLVLCALGVWIYLERKRRLEDSVWMINKDELIFDDPPEIAGRGTFGMVLKAQYRGTTVAVKRVIPPKEKVGTKSVVAATTVVAADKHGKTIDRESLFAKKSNNYNNKGTEEFSFGENIIAISMAQPEQSDTKQKQKRKASLRSSLESLDQYFDHDDVEADKTRKCDLEAGVVFASSTTDAETGVVALNAMTSGETSITNKKNDGLSSGSIIDKLGSGSAHFSNFGTKTGLKKWFNFNDTSGSNGGGGGTTKSYQQLKQDFIFEMKTLSKLRHPCITTVMGCVLSSKEEPMLVLEFMQYGSLYDLLHNASIAMDDGELLSPILQDVARGARFLHAADPKIIHGDLKAANVLVDSRFHAKIADFGLSAKKKYLGAAGTPYWMAPELLKGTSINTAESDVYSFGIILYELYSRKDPYEEDIDELDATTILRQIADPKLNKRPPIPYGCPPKISEIYEECVDAQPVKRPTFEEIDLRIQRLDSGNVEPTPDKVITPHQRYKAKRRQTLLATGGSPEDLIHQVFPPHVAKALLMGEKVKPDRVDIATMFFSDIVGFTTISSQITPDQVSDMLDRLYLKFDFLSVKHDVFKIETIGDAYVGVCNLVSDQSVDHTKRIVEFAIDTIHAASDTLILPEDPSMGAVQIRVGVHCGPLVARVVGSRNPRYCVFGDTVNTTARMESNSLSMRIHLSDRAAQVIQEQAPLTKIECRGTIPIKGKGEMTTYFIQEN